MKCLSMLTCSVMLAGVVLLSGAASMPRSAQAQDNPRPAADVNVQVIRLEHAEAGSVLRVLSSIVELQPDERLSHEQRTNSLIVAARPATLEAVLTLVATLDVPLTQDTQRTAKVFPVKHARDAHSLAATLSAITDRWGIPIAYDASSNAVVAEGSTEQLQQIADLIAALDKPVAASMDSGQITIRLVWLVSGLEGDDLSSAPPDMDSVTAELARYGVTDLELAAQTVVRTSPNEEFSVNFSAWLDRSWSVYFAGETRIDADGRRRLQLQLNGEAAYPDDSGSDLNDMPSRGRRQAPPVERLAIDTTIAAPDGHFIVLGMAPVRHVTSVFVLQINHVE